MNELSEELTDYLLKLSKSQIFNLMIESLDEMEGYNGQSKTSAICRALGAKEIDSETGVKWKLPSINSVKKNFS